MPKEAFSDELINWLSFMISGSLVSMSSCCRIFCGVEDTMPGRFLVKLPAHVDLSLMSHLLSFGGEAHYLQVPSLRTTKG